MGVVEPTRRINEWVIERLKKAVDWGRHGVTYAVLFGSAFHSSVFEDIDIAVLFDKRPRPDDIFSLINDIADALGLSDDRVDLVVLNDDLPCVLIEEALGKGILVYCRDYTHCIDDIIRRLKVCWDFELSYVKLDLLKAALNAVEGGWGSSEGYSR